MKRVLLTGATGFVGANLARRLLQEGHEVHCLVRPAHTSWRIAGLEEQLRISVADLTDLEGLDSVVGRIRPDWVFHLAAYGAYPWQTEVPRTLRTNFLGTVNLVQACLKSGFEIFINTGSSSEYGFKDHAPASTEPMAPNSYYAVGKAAATLFARHAALRERVCITTLRLYSVYGPFEEPGRLIPNIVVYGLKGLLPPLVDAQVARDFVHVGDVEDAYLHLAGNPAGKDGEIYNLGTGVQSTIADVVRLARQVLDLKVEPQWGTMPNREWDTSVWRADIAALRATGWSPRFGLEEGLRKTVDWFRGHPDYLERYLAA